MKNNILIFFFSLLGIILTSTLIRGLILSIKYRGGNNFKVKHSFGGILISIYLFALTFGDLINNRFEVNSIYGISRLFFIIAFFVYSVYIHTVKLKVIEQGVVYNYNFWKWEQINDFEWENRKFVIRIDKGEKEKLKMFNVLGKDKLNITNLFNHYFKVKCK